MYVCILWYDFLSNLCAACPSGFFSPGFPKLKVWFEYHARAFQHVVPKLSKHFRKKDIDPSHYCATWFIKLFIDAVSTCKCVCACDFSSACDVVETDCYSVDDS